MAFNTCTLAADRLKSTNCGYSLNQVVDIYLANYADVTSTTLSEEGNEVSAIVLAASKKFWHIEPSKKSASWSDGLRFTGSNTRYKHHSLTFSVGGKYDKDGVDFLDALSQGRFIAVVKTSDGSYLMLGRTTGVETSEDDNTINQGSGDPTGESGMTFTLSADLEESALPLAETAVQTVLGVA